MGLVTVGKVTVGWRIVPSLGQAFVAVWKDGVCTTLAIPVTGDAREMWIEIADYIVTSDTVPFGLDHGNDTDHISTDK